MNIPAEVIVFICTSLVGFLSLGLHQLVRINAQLSRVITQHEVSSTSVNLRLTALERQEARNLQQAEQMSRFRPSHQSQ